jgi:hypothetical protein
MYLFHQVYESLEDHAPSFCFGFLTPCLPLFPPSPRFLTRIHGVHPNPDSKTPVPDWVDSTVADWIKSEVSHMEDA